MLWGSSNNRLSNNVAQSNEFEGFAMAYGSMGNTLTNNLSQFNLAESYSMYFGCDGNTVFRNRAVGNSNAGILAVESSNNRIQNNRVLLNNVGREVDGGIAVVAGSSSTYVVGNTGQNNGNFDAYDDGSGTGNIWEGNTFGTSNM